MLQRGNAAMETFYSRCLLCTCTPDVTPHLNIFSETGNQLQLSEKISKYLNIQVVAELPQNVCFICMGKLAVTHELVTGSQQATSRLLQIKQQCQHEANQEISGSPTLKLDSYQPTTDGAANYNEDSTNVNPETSLQEEIPMDNSSTEDFEQSTLHCTTEGTQNQTEPFEEVYTSAFSIQEHAIKLEPGENQQNCLYGHQSTENNVMETPLDSNLQGCSVLVPKLLECDLCSFYTDNKTELVTHMQAHGPLKNSVFYGSRPSSLGILKCSQCSLIFAFPEMLSWHTDNCHGSQPTVNLIKINSKQYHFQCVLCQSMFPWQTEIIQHLDKKHKIRHLPFQCTVCSKQFSSRYSLKDHQVKCEKIYPRTASQMKNTKIKCTICNEMFKSEYVMQKHMLVSHEKEQFPLKCMHCNELFSESKQFISHCQEKHAGQPMMKCTICDSDFFTYEGFVQHRMYKHGTQVFTCYICSATFAYPGSLREHIRTVHSSLDTPLSCKVCSGKFKCEKYLQDHIRRVHAAPMLNCEFCSFRTRRKYNLTSHLKTKH